MAVMNPVTGKYEIMPARALGIDVSGLILDLSMWGTVSLPGGAVSAGATVITSAASAALAVGRQGTTNPVLLVDASTATVVTGLSLKGAAAGAAMAVLVTSSGAAENLTIDAKSTGTISLNGVSGTGAVNIGLIATPAFQVVSATAGTGVKVTSAASGAGVAVVALGGAAENLKIDSKGTGQLILNTTATGFVVMGRGSLAGPIQSGAVATFAGTNQTLTAAQLHGGFIEGSPTGAAAYTFDSGANLDTALPGAVTGDWFECIVTIMTAQVVTWGAGAGNALRVRTATTTGTATGEACLVRLVKTGAGAWSIYIVPGSSAT